MHVLRRGVLAHSRFEQRLSYSPSLSSFSRSIYRSITTTSATYTQRKVNPDGPKYKVRWILKDGTEKVTEDPEGMTLLEIAHKHDIDLEGACEQSLACSTCHVIVVDEDYYNRLPEPVDEENDMLDLAFGLTPTSRLGCQVILNKDIDGITVKLPAATRNMYADGHKPKPH